MKYRFLLTALSILTAGLLFTGCQSDDYYKDKAVQKARRFLLDEDRTLDLHQREFVKFNKPVIMAADIIGTLPDERSSAIAGVESQVCIAWVIPKCKDAYIVFGVSDNHLRGWSPNRLIIKSYKRPDRDFILANKSAVLFAANNFLYLSTAMMNRIRFNVPIVYETNFYVDKRLFGDDEEKQEKNIAAYPVQKTFVWNSTRKGWIVFVCGAARHNLNGWKPLFGQETTYEDFNAHVVKKAGETDESKEFKLTPGCPLLSDEEKSKVEAKPTLKAPAKAEAAKGAKVKPEAKAEKTVPEPEVETTSFIKGETTKTFPVKASVTESKAETKPAVDTMSAVKEETKAKTETTAKPVTKAKAEPEVDTMSAVKESTAAPVAKGAVQPVVKSVPAKTAVKTAPETKTVPASKATEKAAVESKPEPKQEAVQTVKEADKKENTPVTKTTTEKNIEKTAVKAKPEIIAKETIKPVKTTQLEAAVTADNKADATKKTTAVKASEPTTETVNNNIAETEKQSTSVKSVDKVVDNGGQGDKKTETATEDNSSDSKTEKVVK
ncbi:MAG: hypothetical protein GY750_06675 [Lentisphaerae bacterium]|nr:hypothetical protein [Lentisphaerota bacterium]MCP4101093.1 hypothetical protein [Lentisphaerota bacterium]